jgi:hypothetical protein
MMINTPTSGEVRRLLVHDRFTSSNPENGFDPDGQAGPGADGGRLRARSGMKDTVKESCRMVNVSPSAPKSTS